MKASQDDSAPGSLARAGHVLEKTAEVTGSLLAVSPRAAGPGVL
jgi:hypothetical protein